MNNKTVSTTTIHARRSLATLVMGATLLAGSHGVHAAAPGSVYAGVQYSLATLDDETDFDLDVLLARVGYVVNDVLRIEARAGVGVGDDTQTVVIDGIPVSATYSVDNLAGIYALFTLPIDRILLYGVAGVTTGKSEVAIRSLSVPPRFLGEITDSGSSSSGSFGFGVEYEIVDQVSIGAEYMRYFSDVDAVGIGFTFRF